MITSNHKTSRLDRQRHYRAPMIFNAKISPEDSIVIPRSLTRAVFYCLILSLAVYFIFFSNYFSLREIIIEGNRFVPAESISSKIPIGQNIFRLDTEKSKKEILTALPQIKDLEIYRGLPDALKVVVLERDVKLIWQSATDSYLISSEGEAAKKIEAGENFNYPKVIDKKNLPVNLGNKIVSAGFVRFIDDIFSQFQSKTGLRPADFEIEETTFDLILRTEGFYVKFNSLRSSKRQLENLVKVLSEKRGEIYEYVDLRIDGWAYYK